ncbi:MAG: Hint domain-containing protein [Hyphomicrobiaceae bacterium]
MGAAATGAMGAGVVTGLQRAEAQIVIGPDSLRNLCNSNPTDVACQCFVRGTMIMTPSGEVPIEYIEAGERVIAANGDCHARTLARQIALQSAGNAAFAHSLTPVLVKKGALGGGIPNADLYVSQGHCFFIDGRLYPIDQLVNGISIVKLADYDADALSTSISSCQPTTSSSPTVP